MQNNASQDEKFIDGLILVMAVATIKFFQIGSIEFCSKNSFLFCVPDALRNIRNNGERKYTPFEEVAIFCLENIFILWLLPNSNPNLNGANATGV